MTSHAPTGDRPAAKGRARSVRTPPVATPAPATGTDRAALLHRAVVEEARRNGLLGGEKSEHVSFRAPPALVEAAKRETGITSTSELGMLALALLAQPDPVAAVMRKMRGGLGRDHALEC